MIRRRLLATGATLVLLAGGAALPRPGRAEGAPAAAAAGPFTDVAAGDPVYPTVDYVARELGVQNPFPEGALGGRRALTRYEFAIAVQRLHEELNRRLRPAEPP